ncbi:hypothetical protein PpBr36_03204 [Pyricularia pennisetigena]|uniref:hypothetical protein n=1 Tax=Pyricularia pennisetigena TaxID=1578925 RepID=UPI00114FCCCE|nr:hypothetical protein PpBr36_03204 [Pyricularia pennisetigena]TLS31273.1 hypothetical protein PpBr36_03204 [Pyricularia pennisetigena]
MPDSVFVQCRGIALDDAFKSRIHVSLRYGDLPASSRLRIWRNFLAAVDRGYEPLYPAQSSPESHLDFHDLAQLVKIQLPPLVSREALCRPDEVIDLPTVDL